MDLYKHYQVAGGRAPGRSRKGCLISAGEISRRVVEGSREGLQDGD